MSNENKKISKREKKRIFWVRAVCSVLALLMIGGMAYYSIAFLFGA